jgi:hypothetical protein
MKPLVNSLRHVALIVFLSPLAACYEGGNRLEQSNPALTLDVYKSITCQCCQEWIHHMEGAGFAAISHHPVDLNRTKSDFGIAPEFQSCHTAVTRDGYIFEGHVPARFVQQFLENPPEGAAGLSVPGMPVGSPGMEVGDRFMPYKVWLLKEDGSTEVFATVERRDQQ